MTMHIRAITPQPTTLNLEARTIEAIVSTGAPVARPGYIEVIDLRGMDVSRAKLGAGIPVLDGHKQGSTDNILGVVDSLDLRSEGLVALMRFRSDDRARQVLADIGDGTLRGLSIGYTVAEWKDTREGQRLIRTATRSTLMEVSIVGVPADPAAHFRAGVTMEQETTSPPDPAVAARAAVNAEIRTIAETAGLTRAWADAQIDAAATAETARAAAFTEMQARGQQQTRSTRAEITFDHTDPAVVATRMGEALFARSHADHQVSAEARPFAHRTMYELARETLVMRGISTTGLFGEALITRALHSTSDFPLLLGDAVSRELRRAYEAAPSGARALARQTTARDFRTKRKITVGAAPPLLAVGEGGEFKSGTVDEAQETYALSTFGRIVGITRQTIVNDDLGGLTDLPRAFGVQARAFENQTIAGLIIANPVMSDGVAVFNAATHLNQKAAAGITLQNLKDDLSAARLAMRKQRSLGGLLIDVSPRFVLVPAELETVMQQALTEVQAVSTAEVNPFSGLTLLVEPRLTSATQWYVAADPAMVDGLEYAYLEGAAGPQTETRAGFEVDGVQIKVRLDFGGGWVDWRGWYRLG